MSVDGLGVNQALHSQLQEWPGPLLVPGPPVTIDPCTLPHLSSYVPLTSFGNGRQPSSITNRIYSPINARNMCVCAFCCEI